jgi:hypothetical protein
MEFQEGTPLPDRVYIFDTTLRDGEQSPGCSMTVPEKLRMAAKLVELGVDILEAGFPIASQGDFDAVDAVSREFPWVQVAALARANKLDVERAAASLQHARRPRIHTFIATSDIHLKHKLRKSGRKCWRPRWPRWNWRGNTPMTWSSRPRTPRVPITITWSRSHAPWSRRGHER